MSLRTPKKILAAVDFSPNSAEALRHAAALAERNGGELHVVHAFRHPTNVGVGPDTVALAPTRGAEKQAVEQRLDEWCSKARAWVPKVSEHLVEQDPSLAILECARKIDADQVVMGVHGRNKLEELFLGSVTREVQAQAPCPVTTVHAEMSDD